MYNVSICYVYVYYTLYCLLMACFGIYTAYAIYAYVDLILNNVYYMYIGYDDMVVSCSADYSVSMYAIGGLSNGWKPIIIIISLLLLLICIIYSLLLLKYIDIPSII